MASAYKVEDYMAKDLVTIHPEAEAYQAILLLLKHQVSGMPVVDDEGKLVGVLSERDCLKTLVHAQYHELPTALVKDLMSVELETVEPDADILRVADLFLQRKFRRLPVLKDGRLVGQISRRDVLRAIREMG